MICWTHFADSAPMSPHVILLLLVPWFVIGPTVAFEVGAIDNVAPADWLSDAEAQLPLLRQLVDQKEEAKEHGVLWHSLDPDQPTDCAHSQQLAPIHRLIEFLASQPPFSLQRWAGVEYWTQIRPPKEPLYLHFDTSETMKSAQYTLAFPRFSTVLYFQEGPAHSPTIIFNTTVQGCRPYRQATICPPAMIATPLDNGGRLGRAAVVTPRRGRLAYFDGGKLHGVLPASPTAAWDGGMRTTLLMNFWGLDPYQAYAQRAGARPSACTKTVPGGVPATTDPPSEELQRDMARAWAPLGTVHAKASELVDVVRLEVRLPLDPGHSVGLVTYRLPRLKTPDDAVRMLDGCAGDEDASFCTIQTAGLQPKSQAAYVERRAARRKKKSVHSEL